jgi:hypothetical protein
VDGSPLGALALLALSGSPSKGAAMSTTFYMTNEAGLVGAALAPLSLARGSTVRTIAGETAADPACMWVPASGAYAHRFISNGLAAFTLSGNISINVWAKEGNTSANIGSSLLFYRRAYGTTNDTLFATLSRGVELTTSLAAQSYSGSPTSTAFADGDMLLIWATMASVGSIGCPTTGDDQTIGSASAGVSGDSYITITENVTEYTPPNEEPLPRFLIGMP